MDDFKALMLSRGDGAVSAAWTTLRESDLMDGDVTVRVTHSTINYKDGLALTGRLPGMRLPLIPGIDFAGTVTASSHAEFAPGDAVILNGWGCGERHYGGYAEYARVKGDWLVRRPAAFTQRAGDGDRHCGLHRDAGGARARSARGDAGKGAGSGDGRGRRSGQRRRRAARQAWLSRHRVDGPATGSGLPAQPRRGRNHRSRGAQRDGPTARQGAVGGRDRRCRLPHARQCACHDELWRRRRRNGARAGHGPSRLGRALHPARGDAHRHRQRHGAEAAAHQSLGAAGDQISILASSPHSR